MGLWVRGGPKGDRSLSDWSPESPGDEEKAGDWWTPSCSGDEEEEQEEKSSSKTSEVWGKETGSEVGGGGRRGKGVQECVCTGVCNKHECSVYTVFIYTYVCVCMGA